MNLSRVAVKQLTASDLTFFAAQFHKPGQRSKQKGINLNADVFVSRFYPGLRDQFEEIHFALTIVGPGAAPAYTVSRKALRTEGAKNWRLNGELIKDPPDQPDRFGTLAEGDIAILAFEGTGRPRHVTLVLVATSLDRRLHSAVCELVRLEQRQSMRAVDEGHIRALLDSTQAQYREFHPLEPLLTADSVEEAIYGRAAAMGQATESNGRGVAITAESIRRQVTTAGETGQLGEEVFERWLVQAGHSEEDFEWVSRSYGRAAFDFEIGRATWESCAEPLFVDVKATRGLHDAAIHMSVAELRWAASHPSYRIARVSSLAPDSASVSILGGVSELASSVLDGLATGLPREVNVDSVEFSPALLNVVHTDTIEWDEG